MPNLDKTTKIRLRTEEIWQVICLKYIFFGPKLNVRNSNVRNLIVRNLWLKYIVKLHYIVSPTLNAASSSPSQLGVGTDSRIFPPVKKHWSFTLISYIKISFFLSIHFFSTISSSIPSFYSMSLFCLIFSFGIFLKLNVLLTISSIPSDDDTEKPHVFPSENSYSTVLNLHRYYGQIYR